MHQKNFVICDEEQDYARNLMQMIGSRRELGFQMHVFQRLEQLEEFAKKRPVQIMLIGEEYPQERREKIPADEHFVLIKEEDRVLADGEKGVYKYQSVDKILAQVLELSIRERKLPGKTKKTVRGRLIGIYSPIHRIGKTKYALEMGKELASRGPVLYLNLEEYSGEEFYFPGEKGQDLGDLLYFAKQENGNLGLKVSMMAGQIGDMDYIMPIPVVQDLQAVSREEWLQLFEQILDKCIYEAVILDLGDSVDGLFEILQRCDTVYTLYIEEPAAKAKLRQYTENLRKTGHEEILEHTVQKAVRTRNGGTVI